jgi:hypothetical protein
MKLKVINLFIWVCLILAFQWPVLFIENSDQFNHVHGRILVANGISMILTLALLVTLLQIINDNNTLSKRSKSNHKSLDPNNRF